jgi:hypothetical protein
MAPDDKQRQFEQIIARLRADYPSIDGGRRWSRPVLVTVAVAAALAWGLLSVAMVEWGVAGVILTCTLVAIIGAGAAADAFRRRGR